MISNAPSAFHLMAKPAGARCNLACEYCFYLKKKELYPDSDFRMNDDVLETYIRQVLEESQTGEAPIAWQGGEPTLMGLDFFRRSIELEKKYQKPGTVIQNTIQTNGVLLDGKWCEFFREHQFLVGLSLDGPKELHDVFRMDKGGGSVFDKVMRALRLLQQHQVEYNILATINSATAEHPIEVYRFFRDTAGVKFIQFIPVVEQDGKASLGGAAVADHSVKPRQYGRFLTSIFDEWVKRDVGKVFVNYFDAALASWAGATPGMCTTAPTCGFALALEHNGDVYSCDHFVEADYYLGNIHKQPLIEIVSSEKQWRFGQNKRERLPRQCRQCEFLFACNGECPKNRFVKAPDGEPGLNYLCEGLKSFYSHIDQPMKIMAELLRRQHPPAEIMQIMKDGKAEAPPKPEKTGRNEFCPCGSGLKFKRCHGK